MQTFYGLLIYFFCRLVFVEAVWLDKLGGGLASFILWLYPLGWNHYLALLLSLCIFPAHSFPSSRMHTPSDTCYTPYTTHAHTTHTPCTQFHQRKNKNRDLLKEFNIYDVSSVIVCRLRWQTTAVLLVFCCNKYSRLFYQELLNGCTTCPVQQDKEK